MNLNQVRRGPSIAAAVALLLVGVTYVSVNRPAEARLAREAGELASLQARLASFESLVAGQPPVQPLIEELERSSNSLRQWASATGDPSSFYATFRTFAENCGVRIERIEPSRPAMTVRPEKRAAAKGGAAGDGNGRSGVDGQVFGYMIEVTGSYEGVSRFIDACDRSSGAGKVVSMRIFPATASAGTPAAAVDVVTGVVETLHLRLNLDSVATTPESETEAPR